MFRADVALLGKSVESTSKRIWSAPFDPADVAEPANATCGKVGFFNFGGGGTAVRFANLEVADCSFACFGGAIRGAVMLGVICFNIGGGTDFRIGFATILDGAKFSGDNFGAIIFA